jgi:hypothetical protein
MITKKLKTERIRKRKVILIWLFPMMFILSVIKMWFTQPIRRRGIHAIVGDTGHGKTKTADGLSREFHNKGWRVYSNSQFNDIVYQFDIDKYFKGGKQIKPLYNCVLILDEIQWEFNKRMNKTREYNDVFVPFIKMVQGHRHDNIIIIYFLTQSWDNLDVQIQRLIHRVHIVRARLYPSLYEWLRKDSMKTSLRPTSIKINSFRKDAFMTSDYEKYVNRKGEVVHKKFKKYSISVSINELMYYNTHAFKGKSSGMTSKNDWNFAISKVQGRKKSVDNEEGIADDENINTLEKT